MVDNLWKVGSFFDGVPIFSTNKTDHHNITKWLNVVLNTYTPNYICRPTSDYKSDFIQQFFFVSHQVGYYS